MESHGKYLGMSSIWTVVTVVVTVVTAVTQNHMDVALA